MKYPPNVQFEAGLVIDAVSKVTNVSPEQILSRVRYKNVALARLACYWLCRNWANMSWPAIGRALGRDHTTVLTGCRDFGRMTDASAKLLVDAARGFLEPPKPVAPEALPEIPDLVPVTMRARLTVDCAPFRLYGGKA